MIKVDGLTFHAGGFWVREVSLDVARGEYFVLLGPNGSGKTLLIKCLCGLIRSVAGSIVIDGEDVTHLKPRLRNIGYVPQDYRLFPHMDVARNVTFALRMHGMSHSEALEEIAPLIEMLRLRPLLDRSTMGLSGGEHQKVALARALALRPKLLLLDEPVSALDDPTRRDVCAELRRVQREFQIATIHVCHSFEEAVMVSDRAGVMFKGRLIQTGTAHTLLRQPSNETVARLLHVENLFSGRATPLDGGSSIIDLAGHQITIPQRCDGDIRFVVRPELLRVSPQGAAGANCIQAELLQIDDLGPYVRLELDAGVRIVAYANPDGIDRRFQMGRRYTVEFPPEALHVLIE